MVRVVLSWCWIGLSAVLWGYAFLHLLNKCSGYQKRELDVICILGMCALTVYSQWFSLFYKVGLAANVIILLINVLIIIGFRKKLIQELHTLKNNIRYVMIFGVVALLIMVLTAQEIGHYDTLLYHAQSIRWIEEYGVVKGLGNLHNRLAYNSSIFCLEALFGLKFLFGRSLHTVNGFVVTVLLGYTMCSFKGFKKAKI